MPGKRVYAKSVSRVRISFSPLFFSLLLKKCFEAAALIFQSSRFLFAAFIPTPR